MSFRQKKISSLVQEALSKIFIHKISDSKLGFITITAVKVSPDLKIAKVYISVYQKENREYALEHLESMKGFLRGELAREVNLRNTPELNFHIDDTQDYVERMDEIFKSIKKNDNSENE